MDLLTPNPTWKVVLASDCLGIQVTGSARRWFSKSIPGMMMGYESGVDAGISVVAMAMSEECSRDEGNDLEVMYVLARRYRCLFYHPG